MRWRHLLSALYNQPLSTTPRQGCYQQSRTIFPTCPQTQGRLPPKAATRSQIATHQTHAYAWLARTLFQYSRPTFFCSRHAPPSSHAAATHPVIGASALRRKGTRDILSLNWDRFQGSFRETCFTVCEMFNAANIEIVYMREFGLWRRGVEIVYKIHRIMGRCCTESSLWLVISRVKMLFLILLCSNWIWERCTALVKYQWLLSFNR